MTHPMLPVVFSQSDPRERGRAHGEMWREEIEELAEIRLRLTLARSRFCSTEDVLRAAEQHLPVLEEHAPHLQVELKGIAEGAGRTPAEIVVLNHYTDLRDVWPQVCGLPQRAAPDPVSAPDPGGCTAVYFNGVHGPVLGQTWDMHASAERFVRMISIEPEGSPLASLCFTLTGCLGMAGIGQDGVAVTINNLSSTDGGLGVVWPAVVRRMLDAPSAQEARDRLLSMPLSSGHHYMVADGRDFFGYETSGELKVLTQTGPRAGHLHTNHCFDPVLRQREDVPRATTSWARINLATTLYAQQRPSTSQELWSLLGTHDNGPGSLCTHQNEPTGDDTLSKTCGRLVMNLQRGEVRVARGCSRDDDGVVLQASRYNAPPPLPPGALRRPAALPNGQ